ncbi:hypothetical protein EVAR_32912_1 [Eumeta japonica]|uniref:Uncharacterized protein n=1 Tax=Eumeta variegata TaxID=151549 RepID=A0A4C2A3C0_EUMVA|nr:hypothetical protein EVAR_32912_1 [Eumeta japonica]
MQILQAPTRHKSWSGPGPRDGSGDDKRCKCYQISHKHGVAIIYLSSNKEIVVLSKNMNEDPNYSVLSRFDGPGCGSASDRVSELNTSGRTGECCSSSKSFHLLIEASKIDLCKMQRKLWSDVWMPKSRNEMFCSMLPLFWRDLQQQTRSDAEPQPGPSKRLRTE